jgi:hypothetical protein
VPIQNEPPMTGRADLRRVELEAAAVLGQPSADRADDGDGEAVEDPLRTRGNTTTRAGRMSTDPATFRTIETDIPGPGRTTSPKEVPAPYVM